MTEGNDGLHRGHDGWLGASAPLGTLLIVVFVPSRDRQGQEIDHELWVTRTLETLAQLFRGATAYPRACGAWRDDDRGGVLIYEEPTIVTSYVAPDALSGVAQVALREFLHRLGRDTRQGEVGIVIGSEYYGITAFDPPEQLRH